MLRSLRAPDYSGAEISFARARAYAVDIPFVLPMSFELQGSIQLEGEIGAPGNVRGGTRDWHPAKRRCVIGDADGKCNTQDLI